MRKCVITSFVDSREMFGRESRAGTGGGKNRNQRPMLTTTAVYASIMYNIYYHESDLAVTKYGQFYTIL